MHSIERYGIVALLFLVVTVVAVLMWDGGKDEKKKDLVGTVTAPPAAKPALDTLEDPVEAAARRLSLVADSQPGPLQRQPQAGSKEWAGEPGAALGAEGVQGSALQEPTALPETLDASAPETQTTQSRREQPAPDQVVGQLEAGATHTYLVRSGDTLSEIAQRELGSSRRWQEIAAANPGLDPARLGVGKKIQIPGARASGASTPTTAKMAGKAVPASSPKAAPSEAGRATWKVGKGENLWKIAAQTLGDGKRWGEIAKLNPGVNPDKLTTGLVLRLPAGAAGAGPRTASAQTTPPKSGASSSASKVAKASKDSPRAKSTPTLVASNTGSERARRGGKVK
jgi:peptidoglycan DL-endopeptidase LytF